MASPIVRLDETEKRIVEIAKGVYNSTTQEGAIKKIIRDHFNSQEFKKRMGNFSKKVGRKKNAKT